MLTEIGVKFGVKDGDSAVKMFDRMGTSLGGLSRETDKAVSHVERAERGFKRHFGGIASHAENMLRRTKASIGQMGSMLSGRALGIGTAVIGGGTLTGMAALAATRVPITQAMTKYDAAGFPKADIDQIEKAAGKVTSQTPGLSTKEYMEGALGLHRAFRENSLQEREEIVSIAAKQGRIFGQTLAEAGDVLTRFNEIWGEKIKDKAGYLKDVVAKQAKAYKTSPFFDPRQLAHVLEFGHGLKEFGWKAPDIIGMTSFMGEHAGEVASKIIGGGIAHLGKLAAMTNRYWTQEKTIKQLADIGTPYAKQQAHFFESQNKSLEVSGTGFMRGVVRGGLETTFKTLAEIRSEFKRKYPQTWETEFTKALEMNRGPALSRLFRGMDKAEQGEISKFMKEQSSAKYEEVEATAAQQDSRLSSKLDLLKQRLGRFANSMAKVYEPPLEVGADIAGKRADAISSAWAGMLSTIRTNEQSALEGIQEGFKSAMGVNVAEMDKTIKALSVAPNPEGWKEWGRVVGESVNEALGKLKGIIDTVQAVDKTVGYYLDKVGERRPGPGVGPLATKKALGPGGEGYALEWSNIWDSLRKRGTVGTLWTGFGQLLPSGLSPVRSEATDSRPFIFDREVEPQRTLRPGAFQQSRLVFSPEINVESKPEITIKARIGHRDIEMVIEDFLVRENARSGRGAGDNALGFGLPR